VANSGPIRASRTTTAHSTIAWGNCRGREAIEMRPSVGFVGLGGMGVPMAANLLKAGYAVRVWNRTPERAGSLLGQGATWADSPASAAEPGGVVLTMVSDDGALEAVTLGERGVLAGLGRGGVPVPCRP